MSKYVKTKEPPCTERYARWCERSAGQIMVSLLLDLYEQKKFYCNGIKFASADLFDYISMNRQFFRSVTC